MYLIHPRRLPRSTLFPYTTLFRSLCRAVCRKGRLMIARKPEWLKVKLPTGENYQKLLSIVFARRQLDFEPRSEEHTSELQSRGHLVCRLLLEKKKKPRKICSYRLR